MYSSSSSHASRQTLPQHSLRPWAWTLLQHDSASLSPPQLPEYRDCLHRAEVACMATVHLTVSANVGRVERVRRNRAPNCMILEAAGGIEPPYGALQAPA